VSGGVGSACSANQLPCVAESIRWTLVSGGGDVYLRHSRVRKDGRTHTYWRLVRSVRRNGKVIQETVAQLGELDAEGRTKARALARQITGRGDQPSLFEERSSGEATAKVRLDRIHLERGRSFGDVWLGWTRPARSSCRRADQALVRVLRAELGHVEADVG